MARPVPRDRRVLWAWAAVTLLTVSCGDSGAGTGADTDTATATATATDAATATDTATDTATATDAATATATATTPPATFEAARDAAFALEQQGADDAAVRDALLLAQALRPDAYGVNVRLGQVCERLELPAEAAAAYARAHAKRPDDLPTLLALATQRVAAGERDAARELLPRLASHPDQAGAVLLLEVRLVTAEAVVSGGAENSGADAAALLERGLSLPPDEVAEALIALGRWCLEHGDHPDARRAFLAALEAEPADTGVLKGLAASCWRLELEEEAQHWQEVLELILGLKDNVFTREQTTQSGEANQRTAIERSEYIRREIEAHEQRLLRLVEIHPGWGQGFLDLAELQADNGDDAAACTTVQAYLQRHGTALSAVERDGLLGRFCR